jgi:MFS family permease
MGLVLQERQQLERNVRILYWTASLMWMRFFIPVLALFYIASQVNIQQFAFIMAAFALSTLLLEIPTGVVADLLGKKNTLILSRCMYIIEIALVAFFNGFWFFLIAKVISGIGVSLSSGTDSAMLYDTLKKLGREKEHQKISGRIAMVSQISMAFVFIIGAALFSIYYKLPAYLSLPLIIAGLVLTFFLKEPYPIGKRPAWKQSHTHLKDATKLFHTNPHLVYLTLTSFSLMALGSILLSLSSVYLAAVDIPIALIGAIAFIGALGMAFGSKNADYFEQRLGHYRAILALQFLTVFALVFMAFLLPWIGAIFYLIIPLMMGLGQVFFNHHVNMHSSQKHRATILSIKSFFDNLGIVILFPIAGWLVKSHGLAAALWFLCGVFIIGSSVSLIYYRVILKKN